ncbi:MAG: hypothetical protein RIQ68_1581, partial [Pseudomonadota bacterium]
MQDEQGLDGQRQTSPQEDLSAQPPVRLRATRHPHWRRRLIAYALLALALICLSPVFFSAYVFNRLGEGPIELDMVRAPFAASLSSRMGEGYSADIGPMALEDSDHGPRIAMQGFSLKDPQGRVIIAAPKADVSINPLLLLLGQIVPRRLELMEVELRLSVMPNGAVALSAGSEPIILTGARRVDDAPPVAEPVVDVPSGDAMIALGEALKALLDNAMRQNSPAGALRRLGISSGRLVFEDQITQRVTRFEDFDLDFDRAEDSAALLVSARGPHGRWRAEALANGRPGDIRTLDISVNNLTLDELQLVAGMRDPGFELSSPMSVQVNVTLGRDNLLAAATGRFAAGSGVFKLDDKDHEAATIDQIEGTFEWNATSRRFDLNRTLVQAGETRFAIAGAVTPPPSGSNAWQISGRLVERSVYGPERPSAKPIFIDRAVLDAKLISSERRLVIDRLEMTGPEVTLAGQAELRLTDQGPSLRFTGRGANMPAVSIVRLWPTPVAPRVRAWFVRALQAGKLEEGSLWLDFDPQT